MITRAKRQRLSSTTTEQNLPSPSHSDNEQIVSQPTSSETKGKRKARKNDSTTHSDAPRIVNTDTIPSQHQDISESTLPNNMITLIIHQLTHQQDRNTIYECTRVNKRFNSIANPYLYQVLNFDKDNINTKRFVPCHYELEQSRKTELQHYIRDLRLFGPQWTEARLARLLPNMPDLHHFSLYPKTMITDKTFQDLPRYCPHLTSLELDNTRLTQVSFTAIGQYCHQLLDLKWRVTKLQSPHWLASLAPNCPLKRLTFDLEPPHHLNDQGFMNNIKQFRALVFLDINIISNTPIHQALLIPNTPTDPLWPQLTHLTLNPCHDIDDTTLISFLESHPHLQQLKLINVQQLTDATLDALATGSLLNSLTHVTLIAKGKKHFSSEAVQRFKQQYPSLDQVDIS